MAENPDVTGDFAAFNTLTLAGTPLSPGGSGLPTLAIRTTSNQSIPDSTPFTLTNFALQFDASGGALATALPGGITVKQNGIYLWLIRQQWQPAGNAGQQRRLDLLVNSTSVCFTFGPIISTPGTVQSVTELIWIMQNNANDAIGVSVYQDSTNAIISTTTNPCTVVGVKIG